MGGVGIVVVHQACRTFFWITNRSEGAGVMNERKNPEGPDLAAGIALSSLADGAMLQGHTDCEAMLDRQ
mgnify:CR=1 FL=1